MKDPMDCTYPHTKLCAHDCVESCLLRNSVTMARMTKKELEDAQAEDEAFRRTCDELGLCQKRNPRCAGCK